jgi:hypothetical protein
MASLMSALKQKLTPNVDLTGGQAAASKLIRSKSGKAGLGSRGPKASNLAEQTAAASSKVGIEQVADRMGMVAKQQQEQAAGIQDKASQDAQELQLSKELAQVEQQAHNLAMGDKKYVHNLEMNGNKLLTQNGVINEESFTKAFLGNETELLEKALGFDWVYGKQQVDYNIAEKKLFGEWEDFFNTYANLGEAQSKQSEAISGGIAGGADIYSSYKKNNPDAGDEEQ